MDACTLDLAQKEEGGTGREKGTARKKKRCGKWREGRKTVRDEPDVSHH
jgi:hypothetical protein